MNPTVSLCVFTFNDLPLLKATLLHEMKWVDQVCILDMASTDETSEFCHAWLRPGIDRYHRRDTNTCPTLGFAEAKNAVSDMASGDWLLHSGSNTVMDWKQAHNIKTVLAHAQGDVLSVETINILPFKECAAHQMEAAVSKMRHDKMERHRLFIRRGSGIRHQGYIHEEPYRGEVNCAGEAVYTALRRYHFEGWGDRHARAMRNSWMLVRALDNPELQKWTNRWWFDTYCKQNEVELRRMAAEYEKCISIKQLT